MTQEHYQRAGAIMQDIKALTYCTISSFASEELKKDFSDWIKEKKAYLQNEFDNLQEEKNKWFMHGIMIVLKMLI